MDQIQKGYESNFDVSNADPENPKVIRTGWFRVGYAFGYGPGREFKSLDEAKKDSRYGGYAGIIRIDWLDNKDFIVTKEILES